MANTYTCVYTNIINYIYIYVYNVCVGCWQGFRLWLQGSASPRVLTSFPVSTDVHVMLGSFVYGLIFFVLLLVLGLVFHKFSFSCYKFKCFNGSFCLMICHHFGSDRLLSVLIFSTFFYFLFLAGFMFQVVHFSLCSLGNICCFSINFNFLLF